MEQKEISAIYQTLDGLEIRLEQTPELGTEYLRDRLLECREKQNTVTDLIVRVNRAYSAVRQQLRAQETALRHAGTTEQAQRMREDRDAMLDEQDALKLLLDALNVRRGNLARTSSDIRLLDKIIEDKFRSPAPPKPAPVRPAPTSLPNVEGQRPEWTGGSGGPLGPTLPSQEEVNKSVEQFVQNVKVQQEAAEAPVKLGQEWVSGVTQAGGEEVSVVGADVAPPPVKEPVMALADDDVDIDKFLES